MRRESSYLEIGRPIIWGLRIRTDWDKDICWEVLLILLVAQVRTLFFFAYNYILLDSWKPLCLNWMYLVILWGSLPEHMHSAKVEFYLLGVWLLTLVSHRRRPWVTVVIAQAELSHPCERSGLSSPFYTLEQWKNELRMKDPLSLSLWLSDKYIC